MNSAIAQKFRRAVRWLAIGFAWACCEAAFRTWDLFDETPTPRPINRVCELLHDAGNALYAWGYRLR